MADGKLYVVITTNPDGVGGGGKKDNDNKSSSSSSENAFKKYLNGELSQLAKRTVNQAISFGIQQVGNLKGQYFAQQSLENVKTLVDTTANVIKSASTGAAAGSFLGPMGTIAGAAIGAGFEILNSAGDVVLNLINVSINAKKQNYEIEQLRIRAGLNSAYNGSRGTEN